LSNNGNVVNINKLLHEYCKCKISPKAVEEIKGRIIDKLYDNAVLLDDMAVKHGRKTIMEEDAIEVFGIVGRTVI
jgi:histone H3/H4